MTIKDNRKKGVGRDSQPKLGTMRKSCRKQLLYKLKSTMF